VSFFFFSHHTAAPLTPLPATDKPRILSVLELGIGFICACLPALNLLVERRWSSKRLELRNSPRTTTDPWPRKIKNYYHTYLRRRETGENESGPDDDNDAKVTGENVVRNGAAAVRRRSLDMELSMRNGRPMSPTSDGLDFDLHQGNTWSRRGGTTPLTNTRLNRWFVPSLDEEGTAGTSVGDGVTKKYNKGESRATIGVVTHVGSTVFAGRVSRTSQPTIGHDRWTRSDPELALHI
jgi:hypothetical protein